MDEEKAIIRQRLIAARAELKIMKHELGSKLETVYDNPAAALSKMQRSYNKDVVGFLNKLETKPARFGFLKGSPLTGSGWTPGFEGKKKLAKVEMKTLGEAVSKFLVVERKVIDLEKAYGADDRTMSGRDKEREKGGMER